MTEKECNAVRLLPIVQEAARHFCCCAEKIKPVKKVVGKKGWISIQKQQSDPSGKKMVKFFFIFAKGEGNKMKDRAEKSCQKAEVQK